jgi:hypothetical protein
MGENKTIWAFDLGTGSIGEAVLILASGINKKGAAKAPVQELRFISGSPCDLRSLADRFLRTADPQVLISRTK